MPHPVISVLRTRATQVRGEALASSSRGSESLGRPCPSRVSQQQSLSISRESRVGEVHRFTGCPRDNHRRRVPEKKISGSSRSRNEFFVIDNRRHSGTMLLELMLRGDSQILRTNSCSSVARNPSPKDGWRFRDTP